MKPFAALVCTLLFTPALAWAEGAVHHDARVTLVPERGQVQVEDTITVEGSERQVFALDPAFVVESLMVDGRSQASNRVQDMLIVELGEPGTHTVAVRTRASFATRTPAQNPPFLNADGGFLAGAWLPNPLSQQTTYQIRVESPSSQRVVLPGRLEEETQTEKDYRAVFATDQPGELPVLITGPFQVAEKMAGGVRVRTYFHPELAPLADRYLEDAARYIAYYAGIIGPYPYSGFAIVSGTQPVGWGLPGMTYMGRRVLALPFIRATSLPHEVLHNWWGNAVEVDYATGNWAEGLTTYMADHAQAASRAGDGGREERLDWLRDYAALPPARDRALTQFVSKTHDATQVVGYGKTAFIFHMLKVRLGADAFDGALARFYAAQRDKVAGWADIQAAFEAESGENLDPFFTAWITRPGAPVLALDNARVDGDGVAFTLAQTQDGALYPLDIPVVVKTEAGEKHLLARLTERRQSYRIYTGARALSLQVDPGLDVFRRLDSAETPPIFRDVSLNAETRLITPGSDADAHSAAHDLAARLLQQDPRPQSADPTARLAAGSYIIAGLESDVSSYLHAVGLPWRAPQELAAPAQAKAYVIRERGTTTLVVMARDAAALQDLTRVLPHYKRRSYVVLNDGLVTDKGTWPPQDGPLSARLD